MPSKFSDIKAGDKIIADGTHRCLRPGAVRTVYADDGRRENMHVVCDEAGTHFLTADTEGNLVGFQKMREHHS